MDFIRFFDLKAGQAIDRWRSGIIRSLNALSSRHHKLDTVADLTNAPSDYRLSVGETAKISISAASTPLNIACEDGVYEIRIAFDHMSFAADSDFYIQANNTEDIGGYNRCDLRASTTFATDEVDVVDSNGNGHFDTAAMRYQHITGTITIIGAVSFGNCIAFGVTLAGSRHTAIVGTRWDTATHTSLGTIVLSEAATGICYVKRIA